MSLRALWDVAAPAKLNLFLHVIGRRADGYHLLQSVMVLIDWCDTLHFEVRGDGRLARHDVGATLPADDLCLRAARALQSEASSLQGADITIDKSVPWGAGLGGGSSDAAATLLALNRLWNLNLPRARLMALGLKLGADVPFFLGGTNAFVEGIGELLRPIKVPEQWLAVIKPRGNIDTGAIFRNPLLARNTEAVTLKGSDFCSFGGAQRAQKTKAGSATHWTDAFGRNDLQPVAVSQCAEVEQALDWLESKWGNGRMTGSGSAVFARAGRTDDSDGRPRVEMPTEVPAGWSGRMCRSLDEHPLAGWVG